MADDLEAVKSAPDAIVIGAMRAGTTTLYRSLQASGLVAVPEAKETDYYLTADHMARGEKWYRKQFRDSILPWVDICPNYTKRDVFPCTAQRVYENAPDAKLIFVARDPVSRAVSQYNHTYMHRASLPSPSELPDTNQGQHILEVSKYAYQLQPYFDLWPSKSILVVDFDELLGQPQRTMMSIMGHIGVEPELVRTMQKAIQKVNSGADLQKMPRWWGQFRGSSVGRYLQARAPRKMIDIARAALKSETAIEIPQFDLAARARIAERLKPDAEQFRKLTGRRFTHWSV